MNTVHDNPELNRHEVHDGDELAGFAEYRLASGKIAFTPTEVDLAFQGSWARTGPGHRGTRGHPAPGLGGVAVCPYVRKVIASDPSRYLDLVPLLDPKGSSCPQALTGAFPGVPQ